MMWRPQHQTTLAVMNWHHRTSDHCHVSDIANLPGESSLGSDAPVRDHPPKIRVIVTMSSQAHTKESVEGAR